MRCTREQDLLHTQRVRRNVCEIRGRFTASLWNEGKI